MRIKPSVILGLAMLCAGTGLGIIVTTADPYTAAPIMIGLFWLSLGIIGGTILLSFIVWMRLKRSDKKP